MKKAVKQSQKLRCVTQMSEEDCGAACLATVCKFYGRYLGLNQSREIIGTGQLGTSLLGLRRGAEALGFNTRAVRASSEILGRLGDTILPSIIHWKGYHWVVLYGRKRKRYAIADPGFGLRFLTRKELEESWNGIMLLLEPDPILFNQQDENVAPAGFSRFIKRILPFKGILAEAVGINIALGVLALSSPFLVQLLTDEVLVRGDTQLLSAIVFGVVFLHLMSSTLRFLQSTLIAHFNQKLQLGLVLEFGYKLLRLPLNYYEARRSGEIASRMRDINEVNMLISQIASSYPSQVFVAIVSLGFMFFYSWRLSLVAIGLATVMTVVTLPFLPILKTKTRNMLVLSAENQGVLVETFKGALVLKSTNAVNQFWEELQSRFGRLANLRFSTIKISIINTTLSSFVSGLGAVTLLGIGSLFVINNEISIGQLLAFKAMQTNVLAFVAATIGLVDEYFRAQTALTRLVEVIDAEPESQLSSHKPDVILSSTDDIFCENLTFYHAGRVSLMENFDVVIPGGKLTALIGESGCGKSTLAKLIAGLYLPVSGSLRIGPYSLQDISLESIRQQIVYVPQDSHFWSRSILENFRMGHPGRRFEEIVKVCQIAGAHDFVSSLPNQYQTVLGEFGANLSGGQRQRLAIARALLSDPPILILDESTSGLDPISETRVLDKLLPYRAGKTTILISHRPSLVRKSEWIVFLEKGHLKLSGSAEQLYSIPGEHLKFLDAYGGEA